MSEHRARIEWQYSGAGFTQGRYSRQHVWTFDGGLRVPASPSPANVPPPYANVSAVDPEEAFVAAIASCHMLTFLYLASQAGLDVCRYDDAAVGAMQPGDNGPWVARVVLSPHITVVGNPPAAEILDRLHDDAHRQCFIANSVRTQIVVEPRSATRR